MAMGGGVSLPQCCVMSGVVFVVFGIAIPTQDEGSCQNSHYNDNHHHQGDNEEGKGAGAVR